eukprot:CAMPEP_0183565256 /NCGR_PEP_ID=MMETSP0371-20130417/108160_1 /TAXON_ID=268820 /ORGANISM="Peridinium aciculiferum, Strain PAER-2" /LENGTH=74 /DNA_ID=CAMNT_0025774377 /DNA_START=350 /DNA_END=571 /DNA_ORIENTATION=+
MEAKTSGALLGRTRDGLQRRHAQMLHKHLDFSSMPMPDRRKRESSLGAAKEWHTRVVSPLERDAARLNFLPEDL